VRQPGMGTVAAGWSLNPKVNFEWSSGRMLVAKRRAGMSGSVLLFNWTSNGYPHMRRPGSFCSANPMIADRWSPTRQLAHCGVVRIPGGKGVYHSKSCPAPTQHSFRVRSTGQTAVGGGKSTSPVCRANARSYRARVRSYCSLAYSALACLRMGMSESASFQSVRKS